MVNPVNTYDKDGDVGIMMKATLSRYVTGKADVYAGLKALRTFQKKKGRTLQRMQTLN